MPASGLQPTRRAATAGLHRRRFRPPRLRRRARVRVWWTRALLGEARRRLVVGSVRSPGLVAAPLERLGEAPPGEPDSRPRDPPLRADGQLPQPSRASPLRGPGDRSPTEPQPRIAGLAPQAPRRRGVEPASGRARRRSDAAQALRGPRRRATGRYLQPTPGARRAAWPRQRLSGTAADMTAAAQPHRHPRAGAGPGCGHVLERRTRPPGPAGHLLSSTTSATCCQTPVCRWRSVAAQSCPPT